MSSEQTYEKLHFRYFLVDLLHELDDKVHQLMLQHLLRVEIGDQEGNIIALRYISKLVPKPALRIASILSQASGVI